MTMTRLEVSPWRAIPSRRSDDGANPVAGLPGAEALGSSAGCRSARSRVQNAFDIFVVRIKPHLGGNADRCSDLGRQQR